MNTQLEETECSKAYRKEFGVSDKMEISSLGQYLIFRRGWELSRVEEERTVMVEIVTGASGDCLAINDWRVSGPKPLGGGSVKQRFWVKLSEIKKSLEL